MRETDDILLRFRAVGTGPPLNVRVRSLLKSALRLHRLRCTSIEENKSRAEPIGAIIERVMRVRMQIAPHCEGPFERSVRRLNAECDAIESRAQDLLQSIVEHSELAGSSATFEG